MTAGWQVVLIDLGSVTSLDASGNSLRDRYPPCLVIGIPATIAVGITQVIALTEQVEADLHA